jgi:hypothetical protein
MLRAERRELEVLPDELRHRRPVVGERDLSLGRAERRRGTPRDPQTWATVAAQPLPAWAIDYQTMGKALGYLGKDVAPGIIEHARQMGVKLPRQLDDSSAELTPQLIVEVIRDVAFHYFPNWRPVAQAIATEPIP